LHGLSSNGNVIGKPESTKAADAIAQAFPREAAAAKGDVIVISSHRYKVDDPQFRAFVKRGEAALQATGNVRGAHVVAVSPDRHAVLVSVLIDSDSGAQSVEQVVENASGGAFAAGITGYHSTGYDFGKQSQTDLEKGELAFGLPAALIVLVLVFGALVAGLVPVLMAILSIIVALGLVALISLGFSLSVFIVNMLTGMGLALGIDYSLFIVSRYREERLLGLAKEYAIAHTGATASRAVLFSGSTFVVALLGMFIVPTSIMRSLALGAILVGIVSVAAALTLLHAVLSVAGDRVNSLRVPYVGRNLGRADAAEGRFWRRIIEAVLRRPVISLVLSVGFMLACAAPIFGLHIGANGVSTLPSGLPSKQGYVLLQRAFPVRNPQPVRIIAVGGNARTPLDFIALKSDLAADPHFGTGAIQRAPEAHSTLLTVPVHGDPVGTTAVAAVRDLRARLIPSVFRDSRAQVYVGGTTAENVDYFDAVSNPTPYVLLFVLGLSFVLLTVAFRSIMVALVSIVLNLLSVGAAYGLLTLVFLDGHGASLFGFQHTHVIDAWVPLFLFSVLFGLSMDYQVFLMSRIKERFDQTGSTRDAVVWGVSSTARIITGAALIIVVVFAGFARGQLVMFQQMGFGVAVALLLDATIIRSVVLPSMLTLLDVRSWYLPRWLDWLPHVEVERPASPGDAAAA
ncbi:MAG TPA: MMPL family transporter, partial [Gaiellaceae bacterium]|nr:MMPL family transporter [Gaiellaceae bacterium]